MADLWGNIASGIGGLLGGSSDVVNTLGSIGNLAGGAYDLYRGYEQQQQYDRYLSSLLASQGVSDKLLKEQAERAKKYFYPIEEKQAEYSLADLQAMRPLQEAQMQYGLDRGMQDIAMAKDVVDPTRDNLIEYLAQGADPQKYMDIASTDVAQAFDKSGVDLQRAYARMGVNPNSGAMQSMTNQNLISRAAAQAGARTEASRLAEDLGIQRKGQALNLAAGIPLTMTQSPVSGTALSQQAAKGFQDAASGLATGAALTGLGSNAAFMSASNQFGNIGQYLNQQASTSTKPGTI